MDKTTYSMIVERLVKLREAHHIGTNDMADYVGVTRQDFIIIYHSPGIQHGRAKRYI